MYSPKIAEQLIPVLYRLAKAQGLPMTQLVDRIIREALIRGNLTLVAQGTMEVSVVPVEPPRNVA